PCGTRGHCPGSRARIWGEGPQSLPRYFAQEAEVRGGMPDRHSRGSAAAGPCGSALAARDAAPPWSRSRRPAGDIRSRGGQQGVRGASIELAEQGDELDLARGALAVGGRVPGLRHDAPPSGWWATYASRAFAPIRLMATGGIVLSCDSWSN